MAVTFGTLRLRDGEWEIDARPHVLIRIKRMFERSYKSSGMLTIKNTDEVCRDLQWLLGRYPLEMNPTELRYLNLRAKAYDVHVAQFEGLTSGTIAPRAFDLALPLREYQKIAADLALRTKGLLIADDVGLGKSAEIIAMLTDPDTRPALIVTLTHLPLQWQRELKKFAPNLLTHIIKKRTPYAVDKPPGRHDFLKPKRQYPDVLITNYHKLSGWVEALAGKIRLIAFDEVQELRRADSDKARAAREIAEKAEYRAGASGTPIYNYGGEFFNVIDVLRPGSLGTRAEFLREWCSDYGTDDKARIADPRSFGAYLREQGVMLRRTRKDVARELPEVVKIPHHIDCNMKVLEEAEDAASELARVIVAQDTAWDKRGQATRDFDVKLRQATGIAKCMAPGTRLLRADGSVEVVERLKEGDLLLGPDGKPRRILATSQGYGNMYRIASTSKRPLFRPYVVNGDHVLALKHSGNIRHGDRFLFGPYVHGDHIEISVAEYLTKSNHFRRMLKGYKIGVEFPERQVPLDPYFVGLWLGDGNSDCAAVTTADPEIREYLFHLAEEQGIFVRTKNPGRTAPTYFLSPQTRGGNARKAIYRNPLRRALKQLGLLNHKHIPENYLINSRSQRMRLLAGLLDSDGYLAVAGVYTIATKWNHLAEQICRLAWSLGLAAKSKPIVSRDQNGNEFPEYSIHVYGNGLEKLPMLVARKKSPPRRQIKDPLRSGIDIRPLGPGPYHGFALDGDGLYLLHDFTVTHNSPFVADFVRLLVEGGEKVVLFAWHRACYDIYMERLKQYNPVMYTGSESPVEKDESRRRFIEGESPILLMSLRAGAGLDGLQETCHTVVIGELDWSPGALDQCIGRIHRDGQTEPVMVYYLISDEGSDPIVSDVLGIKREQIEGVCNPEGELVEKLQIDEDHIKRLAAAYLEKTRAKKAVAAVAVVAGGGADDEDGGEEERDEDDNRDGRLPSNVIPLRPVQSVTPAAAEPEPSSNTDAEEPEADENAEPGSDDEADDGD